MKKHRNRWVCFILSILIVSAAVLAWVFHQNRMENLYGNGIGPVSEEQVPDFLAGKPAYAMGVNSKGMPVFEDPTPPLRKPPWIFRRASPPFRNNSIWNPSPLQIGNHTKPMARRFPQRMKPCGRNACKCPFFWISMKTAFQIRKVKKPALLFCRTGFSIHNDTIL